MKKTLYWISSFTWGILGTLVGFIVWAIFKCMKRQTKTYKGSWATNIYDATNNYCVSIGTFTFVNGWNTYICNHEFGHCIQNAMYGPLVLILVYIPSMISSHMKIHDKMWYEKQATKLGERKW